jgi:pimeloyl-ACP methyl ester carboxylesterase
MDAYIDPKTQAFIRYVNLPGGEPCLVFLAGLGLASTAIYPRVVFEPGLSNRHSILVDLLGCGYSDKPDLFSYSIEDHASTLSGLLDHIGSKHYILVGHSLGGAIAIELAAKRPDLIMQLILAEANLDAGGGLFSKSIAEQSGNEFIRSGYQDLINNLRNAAMKGDYTSSIALGIWQVASPRALHGGAVSAVKGTQPVMWDQLIQLSIPRTYIFGSRSLEDYEDDRALQRRLEEHHIRVAVVPNAGHGMMAENPVGFAALIAEAIAGYGK